MSHRIEFAPSAARALRKLDAALQNRLSPKIDVSAESPRPHEAEKLAGEENRYRQRVGDHRIIYAITDTRRVVTVAMIGHRREVYR